MTTTSTSLSSTLSTSTSHSTPTVTTAEKATSSASSLQSTSGEYESHGNNLSTGAIAGITVGKVVGVAALIIILVLVWNRTKVAAWIHRKTAPKSSGAKLNYEYYPAEQYSRRQVAPAELEPTSMLPEAPGIESVAEKDG
ncbi:hypothetical protein N7462_003654 [Penicillium macrosclerotiorum]|uniref:uncharacterized protein n=1 Tax=Penicillium macrosclerotiorum TaxID=303699 RepID=UPI0025497A44|nr:uncharacterized protein N7462_003654 [Penicillium macrosclerotiorum]KAJ5689262.1 hypothetical protein N7462_003654 [Penicillium macrosclerotiorum]